MSGGALAAVKAYMRVDGDADDTVIAALYAAAEQYLDHAGIRRAKENGSLYDLCLWSLTLHYYDHRDTVGTEAGIPTGLRPILNQLKMVGSL